MATCQWMNEPSDPEANTPARWPKWQKLKKRYMKNFPRTATPIRGATTCTESPR